MRRFQEKKRLTREEEQRLAEAIQASLCSEDPDVIRKGLESYHVLVESNLNLAISWAMPYQYKAFGRVNQIDDFVQVAMLGLCVAALKYKPGIVGFGIFAKRIIQNYLQKDRARNAYCISLGDQYFLEIQRIKNRKQGLDDDHKPFLSDDDAIRKLESIGEGAVYLDQDLNDGEESGEFGDIIPDPRAYIDLETEDENPEKQKQLSQLREALDQLTDYEKEIIRLRYGFNCEEGLSYAEIGKRFGGVKHSTMAKRIQSAEKKIRKIIGFDDWKELPYIKKRGNRRKK